MSSYGEPNIRALPLDEEAVWRYFNCLRKQRQEAGKGFTVPSSFLEAVRFAKFTLDLAGTDSILGSRLLLGSAALEKQAMGPSRQAPGMELEDLKRLHDVLKSDANNIDKPGASMDTHAGQTCVSLSVLKSEKENPSPTTRQNIRRHLWDLGDSSSCSLLCHGKEW